MSHIKSRFHNIKPLPATTKVKKCTDLGILSLNEKVNIQAEGIEIEGVEHIDI